jgi:hypothetical protein
MSLKFNDFSRDLTWIVTAGWVTLNSSAARVKLFFFTTK